MSKSKITSGIVSTKPQEVEPTSLDVTEKGEEFENESEDKDLSESSDDLDSGQAKENLDSPKEQLQGSNAGSEEILSKGPVRAKATNFRLYDPYQKIYFTSIEFTEAPRYSNWMKAQVQAGLLEVEILD